MVAGWATKFGWGKNLSTCYFHGNLRVPPLCHCPLIRPAIKALFPGGGGIGGVPLDSHVICG